MTPEELDAIRARVQRYEETGQSYVGLRLAGDVPVLLAEVERLQTVIEQMRSDGHAPGCETVHTYEISCADSTEWRRKTLADAWICWAGPNGYHGFGSDCLCVHEGCQAHLTEMPASAPSLSNTQEETTNDH